MNKISKFAIVMGMCLMAVVTLSGCSGKSVEDFTSEASGVWQKNGNLQDERLEVFEDATWTSQILEDGIWTTVAQGTIAYNEDYETFEFSDDMSNKIYPVEYSSNNGEVLNFRDNFYRAESSVDGFAAFDGNWYQNADKKSDYYSFENGEWKWFEPDGMGHVSVDNGNLAWDGATGKLVAYAYQDGEIFAEFSINGNDELVTDDASYFFITDEP